MSKYKSRKVKTTLSVLLMEGKTSRDVFQEFFAGEVDVDSFVKIAKEFRIEDLKFSQKMIDTFKRHSVSEDFINSFEVLETEYTDVQALVNAVRDKFEFRSTNEVRSVIDRWSFPSLQVDGQFNIQIETSSYSGATEAQIRALNKENVVKLRHYFVSLPSVQAVPYECVYEEDSHVGEECLR